MVKQWLQMRTSTRPTYSYSLARCSRASESLRSPSRRPPAESICGKGRPYPAGVVLKGNQLRDAKKLRFSRFGLCICASCALMAFDITITISRTAAHTGPRPQQDVRTPRRSHTGCRNHSNGAHQARAISKARSCSGDSSRQERDRRTRPHSRHR